MIIVNHDSCNLLERGSVRVEPKHYMFILALAPSPISFPVITHTWHMKNEEPRYDLDGSRGSAQLKTRQSTSREGTPLKQDNLPQSQC